MLFKLFENFDLNEGHETIFYLQVAVDFWFNEFFLKGQSSVVEDRFNGSKKMGFK